MQVCKAAAHSPHQFKSFHKTGPPILPLVQPGTYLIFNFTPSYFTVLQSHAPSCRFRAARAPENQFFSYLAKTVPSS